MSRAFPRLQSLTLVVASVLVAASCSSSPEPIATGGSVATGGTTLTGGSTATGGTATGGSATGGKATGGLAATGGASATGGSSATGGRATGGSSDAGAPGTGGALLGGAGGRAATGGAAAGGAATGGSAGGGSTGTMSAGCGKASSIPSSQINNGSPISIMAAGLQRRYVLQVPKNYDNTKPYKLVVTLHARDGNDKQMYNWQYYGLLPLSKDEAIFAAPNGQVNNAPCQGTGSGEASCGWPNSKGEDLALVDAVVAQVEQNYCIDTNRIFATGWSYGGSMSFDVGCERPLSNVGANKWGVRAIAIYSAAKLSGNCTPSASVGYYHSHGTHDSVLNYTSAGLPLAQAFAKANGCTWATPTAVSSGAHVCTNLMGCKTGYPLEFCSFNGDHTPYPDNGQSQGSWGPQEAWKFLSQF